MHQTALFILDSLDMAAQRACLRGIKHRIFQDALCHTGQHKAAVAACERSGGLAITLQRRHADLAALAKRHYAAAAA